MHMSNHVVEYVPSDALKPFVELYWEGSFNMRATRGISLQLIPNGCLELIIHLNDLHCDLQKDAAWAQSPDYMIIGLFTNPYEVRFRDHVRVFAMRFKPEGFYNVFGVPGSVFKEQFEDMSLVLGNGFRDFSHRIREERSTAGMILRSENYLLDNLRSKKIDMSYLNAAAELIRNSKEIKIEDLANRIFISKRQLEREFKNKVGISPKQYFRITRINEVIRLLNDDRAMDLTSVALNCGYYDQAHFINDFKRMTGKQPGIFMREKGDYITGSNLANHEMHH
jgi:AraC-like DNA-binding protein